MARVILHVGFHKTGTTAIQEFAWRNRDALRAAGLHYPVFPDWTEIESHAHHQLAHAVAGKSRVLDGGRLQRLIAEWLAAVRPGESLLVSAEAMSRHVMPPIKSASSDGEGQNYARNLADLFAGHDAEIVAVLRRQDDFVRSLYFEHVAKRATGAHLTFPEYRRQAAGSWTRFEEKLDRFMACFPAVNVMIYEDLVQSGDLCIEFFRRLGVDARGLEPVGVVRASPNAVQVELKRRLNHRLELGEYNRRVWSWLSSDEIKAVLDRHCDPANASPWESVEARRQYVEAFEDENRRIAERHFGGGRALFPELKTDGNEGNVVWLGTAVFVQLLISLLTGPAPPARRSGLLWLLARSCFAQR